MSAETAIWPNGEQNEQNISLLIGKRVQLKVNNSRGTVLSVVKNGGRTRFEVELDEVEHPIVTFKEKFFIEDNCNKYPPYPASSQRDNDNRRRRATADASSSIRHPTQARRDDNSAEIADNSSASNAAHASERQQVSRNNGRKKRKNQVPVAEDVDESDDSDSNSEPEENQEESAGSWADVTNVFDELNKDFKEYDGRETYFKWESAGITYSDSFVKRPVDYFRLMFPIDTVSRILAATNKKIPRELHVTDAEFWRYLGIRMAFVLQPVPFGIKDGAFGRGNIADTLFEKGNYGQKYGMKRKRFLFIDDNLQFVEFTAEEKRQVMHVSASIKQSLLCSF